MIRPAIQPPQIMESKYGPKLRKRVASLPGMVSLGTRELFPEIAPAIYLHNDGELSVIRKATEDALARVNMDMIRPGHTVNILCSEHGFSILGGEPYVEMLKTIKDVVQQRTGSEIRLRMAIYRGFQEANEIRDQFKLDDYFGEVVGAGPWDKGIAIETEIGTLYCIAKLFDASWFIHAYYDDPREIYFHRLINRAYKAFTMNYARVETRSAFHSTFMSRGASIIPRAIFDSPFIQERHAFSCFLRSSPAGITSIDADNDLCQIDRRITVSHLKTFGKMVRLLAELDAFIAVWDGGRWGYYLHSGGVCFGVVMNAATDAFDLTQPVALSGSSKYIMKPISAIKALVINQAWPGIAITDLPEFAPTIVVGKDQGDLWLLDSANPGFMDYAVMAETLETAIDFAMKVAKTDKILVFDGSFGYLTTSPSLAEDMLKRASEVSRRVEEEYLPKWLRQRGIDPAET